MVNEDEVSGIRRLYDQFYANRTVTGVAAYLGYTHPSYRVSDLDAEQEPHVYSRGMAPPEILLISAAGRSVKTHRCRCATSWR